MRAFVVVVEDVETGRAKISQEAYKTLKEAQEFIIGRSGKAYKLDNYTYNGDLRYTYTIHEVTIRGE